MLLVGSQDVGDGRAKTSPGVDAVADRKEAGGALQRVETLVHIAVLTGEVRVQGFLPVAVSAVAIRHQGSCRGRR